MKPHLILTLAGVALASVLVGGEAQPRPEPRYYPVTPAAGTSLPFSEAVQMGDLLFVSGQIGNVPGTLTVVPGGLDAEARRALENMKAILERHGTSLDHVVKVTVFLTDMKEWPAFNGIYREFFKTNLPARSAVGATGLALGARVELECIAYIPPAT